MSTSFLLILLGLLTVGQALQHGTVDNDTIILTKRANLTLEDILGYPDTALFTRHLDKRTLHGLRHALSGRPDMITIPLVKTASDDYDIWFVNVDMSRWRRNLNFQIDTYGICSWVRHTPRGKMAEVHCPERAFSPLRHIPSIACESQVAIGGATWEGFLVERHLPSTTHGTLGWSLSDSRVPKKIQTLRKFLSNFRFPVFALYFSYHGAKLDIGGVDTDFVIEYHKVVKTRPQQTWLLGSARIYVDSTVVLPDGETGPNIETAFDTSTPYIYGPPSQVAKIWGSMSRNRNIHSGRGHVVYFQWGNGRKWPLRSDRGEIEDWDWYRGLFKPGDSQMVHWVLGTEFMFGKYLVFNADHEEPQIGIGYRRSAPPHEPPPAYVAPHADVHPPAYAAPRADVHPPAYAPPPANVHPPANAPPPVNAPPPAYAPPPENVHPPAYAPPPANVHPPAYAPRPENVHPPAYAPPPENVHPPAYAPPPENVHPPAYAPPAANVHPPANVPPPANVHPPAYSP